MRYLAIALAASWTLLGCVQQADVVGYSVAPLDTGGSGGAAGTAGASGMMAAITGGAGASASGGTGASASGGSGAMDSGGSGATDAGAQEPMCDMMTTVTLAWFAGVARDCTFDFSNPQLVALLIDHIFQHDVPPVDPEAAPPDVLCNRLSTPDYIARVRLGNDGRWVICPAYCAALNQWIDEHNSELQECLPDAG